VRVELAVDYSALVDPPFRDKNLKPDAQAVHAFAVTNGWEYYIGTGSQPLPGVLFRDERGKSRQLQRSGNIVRIPGPPLVEVGNCAYSYTVNLNIFSVTWGYLAGVLTEPAPAVVVETTNARRVRELPARPVGAAHVPLGPEGGDGIAYVAPEAAGWAQAAFGPELIRLLNDPLLPFDVEIAEGWLFLYCPSELSVPDPTVWQRTFTVLEAVRASIAAATTGQVASDAGAGAGAGAASQTGSLEPDPAADPRNRPAETPAGPPLTTPALTIPDGSDPSVRRTTWRYYGAVIAVFLLGVVGVAIFLPR
jgi:hypothetical protein